MDGGLPTHPCSVRMSGGLECMRRNSCRGASGIVTHPMCAVIHGSHWTGGKLSKSFAVYFMTLYFLRISVVFSIGSASTVCPWAVVVVARNIEL